MKLLVRYENEIQAIELDSKAAEQLWISLDIEDEVLTQEEREQRLQKAFDEKFNKPDYNNWHRETRHIDPTPKRRRMDGKAGYIQADEDDAAFDIMDYLLITSDAEAHDSKSEYDSVCEWIRSTLVKKPEWAEAFIAVRLNGEAIREYAVRIGADENNITKKLKRAEKKLKENYKKRQI